MLLRDLVHRLTPEQFTQLLQELAVESYERGASGWRGLLRVRDELHDVVTARARNTLARRLGIAVREAS